MTSFIQQILQKKKTSCSVSGDQSRLQAPSKALFVADQRNPLETLSRHAPRKNLLPFLPTSQLLELTLMVCCANLKTDPVINLDSNRSAPVQRFTHDMNYGLMGRTMIDLSAAWKIILHRISLSVLFWAIIVCVFSSLCSSWQEWWEILIIQEAYETRAFLSRACELGWEVMREERCSERVSFCSTTSSLCGPICLCHAAALH